MTLERNSGVLLHISSLPGPYGIGDLGPSAFRFADLLAENGFTYWQILPLGPLGAGNSPYQAFSAYAGDPVYVSPESLISWGLLSQEEVSPVPEFHKKEVEFDKVRIWKEQIMKLAWKAFQKGANPDLQHEYHHFLEEHGWWLSDYALFMAIMDSKGHGRWNSWGEGLRDREPDEMKAAKEELKEEIEFEKFKQFQFFRQYFILKNYANSKGIKIFGDMPLYVSYESSDVWSNQNLFLLDNEGNPTVVGGVPPDYFSEEGQLWGNPVYNWDALAAQNHHWWMARIYFNLHLFNLVRIDHFRGLESFWAIPSSSETAKRGYWMPVHGHEILSLLQSRMDTLPIVAEDLGLITPEVEQLRDRFGLPGMKVLQFAFAEGGDGVHLPHQYRSNNLVYTGTHDNNTLKGWWNNLVQTERKNVLHYLAGNRGPIPDRLIELAWLSVACTAIVPMQDLLQLGETARMNVPGLADGNWGWRFTWKQLSKERLKWFKQLNQTYQR
jgi:4-alpha-glucanotransferase